jgi:hypothetical protein
MPLETNHYIAGGRLYFTPEGGAEREVGDIIDVSLNVETTTAECLSRSNGAAEVVGEAVTKRDYALTFTTTNLSAPNLAAYFYGNVAPKIYVEGDTYHNGKVLAEFDAGDAYAEGDTVIHSGGIYEALSAISAGTWDESDWNRLGGATIKVVSANKVSKITGKIRIAGEPLDGKKITIVASKVSLAPSGDLALMGDEYSQLVFEGKLQRADGDVFKIFEEQA